jgi:hypothetical protein
MTLAASTHQLVHQVQGALHGVLAGIQAPMFHQLGQLGRVGRVQEEVQPGRSWAACRRRLSRLRSMGGSCAPDPAGRPGRRFSSSMFILDVKWGSGPNPEPGYKNILPV